MNLRLKINLALLIVFVIALGAATAVLYRLAYDNAIERIEAQIDVLRAQALAVRRYTSEEIQPLLSDASELQFLPQTVPSFSAQTVFRSFRDWRPEFDYKEAVLNPTNPADLAADWEADIIARLREDRALERLSTMRETAEGPRYAVAFPLVIRDEQCLVCHSTPEAAPPSMIALYGDDGGFGWQLGEVVGAQIFSAPLAIAEASAIETLKLAVLAMLGVFAALLVVVNVLLSRMIVSPVRQMALVAERVSKGELDFPEYRREGSDEIASLSASFNRMRRSLDKAMKMLDGA